MLRPSRLKRACLAIALGGALASLSLPSQAYTFRMASKGIVAPPTLIASLSTLPTNLSFGNVQVGQAQSASFTLSNTGGAAAAAIQYVLPTGYTMTGTCGTSLAAGGQCSSSILFSPTLAQLYGGNLAITYSGGSSQLALSGTGKGATLQESPASLAFGQVATGIASAASTFTLTNTGVGPVTVGTIALPAGAALVSDNCSGKTLAAGTSCTAGLTVTPSATGAYSGTVTVPSSAPSSTIALSATGLQHDSLLVPAAAAATGEFLAGSWTNTGFGWVWNVAGYSSSPPANTSVHFETLLTNNTGAPESIYLNASVDDAVTGLKIGGVSQSLGCLATANFLAVCHAGPYTLPPGTTRLDMQALNGGGPAGLSAWVTVGSPTGAVLTSTNSATGFFTTTAGF